MRRFSLTLIAIAALATTLHSEVVVNTAGKLSEQINDKSITTLTVEGELNAIDFAYIAYELKELTSINLSNTTITAVESDSLIFGNTHNYKAGELPQFCFAVKALTTIVLPSTGLTSIGEGAFAGCSALTAITLPQSLVAMGDYAFSDCSALTEITIPETLVTLSKGAFAHCQALKTVDANSVKIIGADAFMDCSALSQITLGSTLEEIGAGAFRGCSSTLEISIPADNNLTRIGDLAFQNAGLEGFDFTKFPKLQSIGTWAFANAILSEANVNRAYTGGPSFFYNTPLTQATLAEDATEVVKTAFAGCDNLAAITIPEMVTSIGEYAFYDCKSIGTMSIPASVTEIGNYAFAGCEGFAWIKSLNTSAPAIEENTFTDYSKHLYVNGSEARNNYKNAPYWSNFTNIRALGTLLGDVNVDTKVNVTDVTMTVDYILSGSTPNFKDEAADIEANGTIDVADATEIINMVLTDTRKVVSEDEIALTATNSGHNSTSDNLYLKPTTVKAGESADFAICLSNGMPYSSYQFDVTMPAGFNAERATASLQANRHNASHAIKYNAVANNTLRVVVTSLGNDEISGISDAVVKISLTTDEDLAEGDYEVSTDNIVLAYNDINRMEVTAYSPEPSVSTVTVNNSITGIDDVAVDGIDIYSAGRHIIISGANAADVASVYTTGGTEIYRGTERKIAVDAEGIYIVTINNHSRKVVVK